ncbi:MAG: hypothetical protein QNJ61_09055 [Desulfobacterales bacterium]|nr:hypothetical protein [Desulfobacterales bacterium]
MIRNAALIWQKPLPDWRQKMTVCVREAAAARTTATRVFFRADDVGVPGDRFSEMIGLFIQHDTPLNLAVVPAWLTAPRWRALQHAGRAAAHLWCWHQHGWRHHNHESRGKKQEFGPARSPGALRRDLDRGRRRLETLMGPSFYPVFTPPWNRCSIQTLDYLHQAGYRAVSRSRASRPACPAGFKDAAVDVDLHTRKDPTPAAGWDAFLEALARGLRRPVCGLMLHHQRMNANALEGLACLLALLKEQRRFVWEDFRGLCPP